MMALTDFPLPGIQFFMSGNPYSGSYQGLNYLVVPVKADVDKDVDSHLAVKVWYGMLCSDLADIIANADFSLDTDGLAATITWLREQHQVYLQRQK